MRRSSLIIIIENYVTGGANKYTEDLIYCLKDKFQNIEIWGNTDALNSFNKLRLPDSIKFKSILIFNAGELLKTKSRLPRFFFSLILVPMFFLLNIFSLIILKFNLKKTKSGLVLLCNGGYPASIFLDLAPLFIKPDLSPTMTIVSTPARKENIVFIYFWQKLDEIVYSYCKNIVVNSMAIKNELMIKYKFPENKISIIKNGIEDNRLSRNHTKDIIEIGFISRIEKTKGIVELLNTYHKLRLKYKNIKLVIAGSGALSSLVQDSALQDSSVCYLGHMNTGLNELLHEIDIYVLPSYQEGLPYGIIEASMAECAIIASDVGGIPELIKNNYSGILIHPKNETALYLALENLIINKELRINLAHNARENFINNLSMSKMQQQVEKVLL